MSLQNLLLVGLSLVFFAWGGLDAVTFLVALIIVNYLVGLLSLKFRKILLAGVVCNVGALFCFKYLNTTLSWIGNLTSTPPLTVDLLVPLGISFIIFHNISYLLDIYNGKVKANKNLLEVALYILFFPKLIQGSIVKYYDMEKELKHRETRLSDCVSGAQRFVVGLAKKVLVADILAETVTDIFSRSLSGIDVPTAWLGVLLYTFQIYTDFSGYSDMAIGLGRFFGFHFKENFDFPYTSLSITEFWRRWHISLGAWFREYLYFPLGGNRKGNVYFNLFVVFLVTGIWHGATLVYWLWGMAHGVCVMLERYLFKTKWYGKIPKFIKWFFTFFIVSVGWIAFQTGDLGGFIDYAKNLVGLNPQELTFHFPYFLTNRVIFLVLLCAVCIFVFSRKRVQQKLLALRQGSRVYCAVTYAGTLLLFALSMMAAVSSTYSPFIYFQF